MFKCVSSWLCEADELSGMIRVKLKDESGVGLDKITEENATNRSDIGATEPEPCDSLSLFQQSPDSRCEIDIDFSKKVIIDRILIVSEARNLEIYFNATLDYLGTIKGLADAQTPDGMVTFFKAEAQISSPTREISLTKLKIKLLSLPRKTACMVLQFDVFGRIPKEESQAPQVPPRPTGMNLAALMGSMLQSSTSSAASSSNQNIEKQLQASEQRIMKGVANMMMTLEKRIVDKIDAQSKEINERVLKMEDKLVCIEQLFLLHNQPAVD